METLADMLLGVVFDFADTHPATTLIILVLFRPVVAGGIYVRIVKDLKAIMRR